jgi:hypothetical protein
MREPGHASLTEGISNRTAKGDKTRRDDLCGSTCVPPATPAPARQRQRFVVQRYGSYGRMERLYLKGFLIRYLGTLVELHQGRLKATGAEATPLATALYSIKRDPWQQ